jgi:hypothetical protein
VDLQTTHYLLSFSSTVPENQREARGLCPAPARRRCLACRSKSAQVCPKADRTALSVPPVLSV